MYAMLCTRPDVSFALSVTSRYQSNFGEDHWTVVKSILKYLRRTKDTFLIFGGEDELVVKGYTDASFQTDKDDSTSQSEFVFCLNGGAVSWKSSKQDMVADSMTEAEYIAASEAAKEAVWIRKLFLSWVSFQVHPVQWTSIVIIVVPLRLQRSLDHTRSPDIYYGSITSSVTLLREVM
jgi:hypothetical protein